MPNWLVVGLRLVPIIINAVNFVEKFIRSLKGKDKEDAAVELAGDMLQTIEGIAGKDLVDDPLVQQAIRNVMQAVVSLQNVVRDVKAKQAAG